MAKKLFTKGAPKPATSGRKKGTPNKRTTEQREAFETVMELLEKRMTDGDDVIKSLSPARAAELYSTLLNYKKPKLNSNSNSDRVEHSGGINIVVSYESDEDIKVEKDDD